jgi:hypothetical protein
VDELLAFLLHILGVFVLNHDPDTGKPERLLWIFSLTPQECCYGCDQKNHYTFPALAWSLVAVHKLAHLKTIVK